MIRPLPWRLSTVVYISSHTPICLLSLNTSPNHPTAPCTYSTHTALSPMCSTPTTMPADSGSDSQTATTTQSGQSSVIMTAPARVAMSPTGESSLR